MNVLIVGSGGREHALAWKIAKSSHVDKIYCAPGNAGIEEYAECVPIGVLDFDALVAFAKEKEIGLTVIGMDDPLVAGIVDAFEAAGLRVFGPGKAAAILEAIGRDLANGDWGTYDWFSTNNGGDYAMDLSLRFDGPDGEGHDYLYINVSPAMDETVETLKALGLVTDEDLVTYRELNPEDYAAWEQEAADASPLSADLLPGGETAAVWGVTAA